LNSALRMPSCKRSITGWYFSTGYNKACYHYSVKNA
jgi:hypothetical protein